MGEAFDPYLQWLGIRDPERPPNHYRLLGVALYEDDTEVLANAADRQMAHVRTFQTGKHSVESQQLLNEVAAAKICLTNAEKKTAYDALIRGRDVSPRPDAAPGVAAAPASSPPAVGPAWPRSRIFSAVALGALIAAASAALVFGVFSAHRGAKARDTAIVPIADPAHDDTSKERRSDAGTAKPAGLPEPDSGHGAKPRRDQRDVPPVGSGKQAQREPPSHVETPLKRPPAERPSPAASRPVPPAGHPQRPESEPAKPEDRRTEVPAKQSQAKALRDIRELFRADYAVADDRNHRERLAERRAKLAEKLLRQAEGTHDDPTARYVLYLEARDLAVAAGQPALLKRILKELGSTYRVDSDAMAIETLLSAAADPHRESSVNRELGRMAMEVAADAMKKEDYDAARRLAEAARDMARRAGDNPTVKRLASLARDIEDCRHLKAQFPQAEKRLAQNPRDGEAKQTAAKYYCLVKIDWPRGLSLLVEEDSLKDVRLAEMALPPASPPSGTPSLPREKIVALADLWSTAAKQVDPSLQRLARERAVYWCNLARQQHLPARDRRRIERRLNELGD